MQFNFKHNHIVNTILHTTNNKHCSNTHLLHNRRKALKKLRDLGLFGIATSYGIFSYKNLDIENIDSINLETKVTLDFIDTQSSINSNPLYSNINTSNIESNQTIINSLFQSNIPQELLSLPLKHFSIPHEYALIIKSNTKQNKDTPILITPLISNKYINYTGYYLDMPVKHINTPFLTYNYDSLASLLKDLESKQFYVRYYNLDSMFIEYIKDITISLLLDRLKDFDEINFLSYKITNNSIQYKEYMQSNMFNHKAIDNKGNITDTNFTISLDNILKYQVPKSSSLYQKFKALESNNDDASAIDAYNEVLEILAYYKNNLFATVGNNLDKNKARRLLQCLNTIGQNNIRALYVGVNPTRKYPMKRPKFIGRLATTIIIEDGLWIG